MGNRRDWDMDHSLKTAYPNKTVSRLKLPLRLLAIVDQRKPSAPSSTELSLEAEGHDTLGVGFELGSELLVQLDLGDLIPCGV